MTILRSFTNNNYQYEAFKYNGVMYGVHLTAEGEPELYVEENLIYGFTEVSGEGYGIRYTDPVSERAYAIVVDNGVYLELAE